CTINPVICINLINCHSVNRKYIRRTTKKSLTGTKKNRQKVMEFAGPEAANHYF
ncbi:hypothetical protein LOAG_14558, partial [Loa loa]